jgi:hypothetical protein
LIWDSKYWKDDLLRWAEDLRKRSQQRRWSDKSLARLEQTIMLGFYSIRKLAEARKLSQRTIERQVSLTAYPWRGKLVTRYNWHRLSELYDFERQEDTSRDLRFICNQIVHSYVFVAEFDEAGLLQGVVFCSDRQRNQRSFCIRLIDVVELFEIVGNDYPDKATSIWSNEKKDYQVLCE